MTPERWRAVQEVLDAALERPETERDAYLAEVARTDASLVEEVRALLAADRSDGFLERPPAAPPGAAPGAAVGADQGESLVGRDVGPYHILRALGEGGMGVVYEAVQRTPVERRVAVKLVKWGMDTRQVIARFESERQALAMMSHPSIASVYDAGATERGRPYFVMEYVSGVPITEYCDTHRLGVRDRLGLFLKVCDAIQHAHQKGIIHRDIKPANVLVALADGAPVPKVIDFGIAKATAHRLTERTLYTEAGQLIGTPSYMSPEQAEMTNLDIDTRSDVYSLGALLYELLAGAQPFDSTELRRLPVDELRRRIREEDPPLPSARVLRSSDAQDLAHRRGHPEAASLAREVRGDLDWIVAKALAKNRSDRYATASDLAEDVSRHLRHVPVRASPQHASYRLGKFVRRHRLGVAAGGAVALALLTAVGGIAVGLVRAREAEERALVEAAKTKAVNDFLQETLGAASPQEGLGRETTVLAAVRAAAERVGESFGDQPLVEAAVRSTIGKTFAELGMYEEADGHLERALEIQLLHLGENHADVAHTLHQLANSAQMRAQFDRSETLNRHAIAIWHRLPETPQDVLGETLNNLAVDRGTLGDWAEAERILREATRLMRDGGSNHLGTALGNLAIALKHLGRSEEAEPYYLEAIEEARRLTRGRDLKLGAALNSYGRFHEDRGDDEAALPLYEEALALYAGAVGEDSFKGTIQGNYGACLLRLGRLDAAETHLLEAHRIHGKYRGGDNRLTQRAVRNLVTLYESMGREDRAAAFRELLIEGDP